MLKTYKGSCTAYPTPRPRPSTPTCRRLSGADGAAARGVVMPGVKKRGIAANLNYATSDKPPPD
jgi:hypothetical protein